MVVLIPVVMVSIAASPMQVGVLKARTTLTVRAVARADLYRWVPGSDSRSFYCISHVFVAEVLPRVSAASAQPIESRKPVDEGQPNDQLTDCSGSRPQWFLWHANRSS